MNLIRDMNQSNRPFHDAKKESYRDGFAKLDKSGVLFLKSDNSTETTIVEEPKILDASFIKSGLLTAAVLIETLSAPDFNALEISSIDLIPPPTVSGIKQFFAVSCIKGRILFLSYNDATVSW